MLCEASIPGSAGLGAWGASRLWISHFRLCRVPRLCLVPRLVLLVAVSLLVHTEEKLLNKGLDSRPLVNGLVEVLDE